MFRRFLQALPVALLLAAPLAPAPVVADEADLAPVQIFDRIGALEAWPISRGAGVLVAVLDGGVALHHPELAGRLAINAIEAAGSAGVDDDGNGYLDDVLGWDFLDNDGIPIVIAGERAAGNGVDDDGDGRVDGGVSHGTYTAGLIAGRSMGVAPEAMILPVRIVDDEGRGTPAQTAAGIDYAGRRGARVIYIGVGFPQEDASVRAAIVRATAAGSLVVAPAGNAIDVRYPAAYPEVLDVGAYEGEGPAPFSAWGASVDIAAPGTRLYVPRVAPQSADLGYARVTGTSYSAALVAGAAALVRSAAPGLSVEATALLLTASATPLAQGGGIGALHAGRAVRAATGR